MYTKNIVDNRSASPTHLSQLKKNSYQLLIDDNGSAALPSTGTPSPLPKTPHRHGNTLGRTLLDLAIGSLRAGPSRFVSSPPSVVCGGVDAARRRVRPLRPRLPTNGAPRSSAEALPRPQRCQSPPPPGPTSNGVRLGLPPSTARRILRSLVSSIQKLWRSPRAPEPARGESAMTAASARGGGTTPARSGRDWFGLDGRGSGASSALVAAAALAAASMAVARGRRSRALFLTAPSERPLFRRRPSIPSRLRRILGARCCGRIGSGLDGDDPGPFF